MRSRTSAAVGSTLFFILAPGTVVGLIPWLISRWRTEQPLPFWVLAQALGAILVCAGLFVLVHAFVRFAAARGTPAPVTPTQHLVVDGFHRHVRNPMYVAILVANLGQTLVFGSLGLLVYSLVVWAVFTGFVRLVEEPMLVRQFGAEYQTYRRHVRAWVPRVRPWTPGQSTQASTG